MSGKDEEAVPVVAVVVVVAPAADNCAGFNESDKREEETLPERGLCC